MNKAIYIALLTSVAAMQATAQQITFEKSYNYGLAEAANCVQQTFDGGYIMAGRQGIAMNVMDLMLIKTDSAGNEEWKKFYGTGANENVAYSIEQTADSGYIACGRTTVMGMGSNVYLMKTDANGDTLWTKHYGTTLGESGNSVKQTYDGGYIIAGLWADTTACLIKTDANGDTLWKKTYLPAGHQASVAFSVVQTIDSGYVLAGATVLGGYADAYIVRTDANGDTVWTQMVGGAVADWGEAVALTSDGGFIVTGNTYSFGAGSYDVYLIRLDANGDTLWTRTYGDVNDDAAYSVQQTTDGGFVIGGFTAWPLSTDYDAWLVKTDSNGAMEWERKLGGADDEGGEYAIQTADGGYALCGMTQSFSATPAAYFVKTDSAGNVAAGVEQFGPSTALRVTVYPNPAREQFTISGNYGLPAVLELYDVMGRKVKEFEVTPFDCAQGAKKFTVDVQGWSRGIYLYRLVDYGGGVVSGKVVVE